MNDMLSGLQGPEVALATMEVHFCFFFLSLYPFCHFTKASPTTPFTHVACMRSLLHMQSTFCCSAILSWWVHELACSASDALAYDFPVAAIPPFKSASLPPKSFCAHYIKSLFRCCVSRNVVICVVGATVLSGRCQ